jgi:hypothetical membrane protein
MIIKTEMMKTGVKNRVFEAACILLLAGMFTVPFLNVPPFSIISDTLSDLGAQGTSFSWIINSLLLFSSICALVAGWEYYEGFAFQRIILAFFSISMIMAAFINQSPAGQVTLINTGEDAWHSFFCGTASLSFIMLSLATAFILDNNYERVLTTLAGLSVLLLTVITGRWEQTVGIWQRVILIIMFGWMVFTFRQREL